MSFVNTSMEILKKIQAKLPSRIANGSHNVAFLLLAIVLFGAFLRMYEFHDWLRFNPDQARDAIITFDMTRGEIPLLGPLAGGTEFRLGPITHYFQYVSGLIFGFRADTLAYPDLLFSIGAIPLFFLLITRMFGRKWGLFAAFFTALSGFMVWYGHFAWNPNSMPFFTALFLLAAQSFFEKDSKWRYEWAILLGIAIGVGVQLHTFLLILLPFLTALLFGYLIIRRSLPKLAAALVLLVAIVFNIPQIMYEMKNNYANTEAFLKAFNSETGGGRSYLTRAGQAAMCEVRSNAYIVSALGHSDACDRFISTVKKKPWKHPVDTAHAIVEIIFTVGGFLLLGYFAWREQDPKRRFLLVSVLVYSIFLFLLIIPVANEVAMRYYLAGAFIPFVLLVAWGKFFEERRRMFLWGFVLLLLGLVVSNGVFLKKEYDLFQSGKRSNGDTAILGEVEPLSAFMSRYISPGETAHLIGMRNYRKRFHKALAFPLHIEGKELVRWEQKGFPDGTGPVFLIRKKTKSYDEATEINGRPILDRITSGRVSVFLMRR